MSKRYLLGIDKGTSVIKSVIFDLKGNEIAISQERTPMEVPYPGWHEEDMEGTWLATKRTIHQVLEKAGVLKDEVAGIGISGHMGGAWLIDPEGKPVRKAICWPDSRALTLLNEWKENGTLTRIYDISGNVAIPGITVVVIRWLKDNEPDSLKKAKYVLLAKDWIRYKLTGIVNTDESDISFVPCDIWKRDYSMELFEVCGIAEYRHLFPEVVNSETVVGGVLPEVAREIGLMPGTPVVAGLGDAVANSLGTGVIEDGQSVSVVGTSFLNDLTTNTPVMEPRNVGFLFTMVGGKWMRLVSNTGGGSLSLDWFLNNFCGEEKRLAAEKNISVFEILEDEIKQVPIGASGVLFHPYLNTAGVIAPFSDPLARALFFGMSVQNTRQDMLRAVYEGVALSMVDCYSAIPVSIREIRLSGGGARSSIWCQIFSDCMNAHLLVPSGSESGAKGVAILAGVGVGIYKSFEDAVAKSVKIEREYYPNPESAERYANLYGLYKKVREVFPELWRSRYEVYQGY